MAFLTVNGIPSTCAEDSLTETLREIGSTAAAFDGTITKTRQSTKTDLKFGTIPLSSADALAWSNLLRGKGETWSFTSHVYGSKGLGASSLANYSVGAGGKFGNGLALGSGTGTASFVAVLGSIWTAAFWLSVNGAASDHYIIDSTGRKWFNGVRNDATSTSAFFAVTAGTAVLTNASGFTNVYDDLVLLPYLVPTSWPEVWGIATTASSSLPSLTIAGDIVSEASTRTCLGSVESTKPLRGTLSGVTAATHRVLDVALVEV